MFPDLTDALQVTAEFAQSRTDRMVNDLSAVPLPLHQPHLCQHLEVFGDGLSADREFLAPGIENAEAEGTPAFLETSDRRNVHLYRSLGFGVDAEYVLPDGGPRTWAMTRKPPTL